MYIEIKANVHSGYTKGTLKHILMMRSFYLLAMAGEYKRRELSLIEISTIVILSTENLHRFIRYCFIAISIFGLFLVWHKQKYKTGNDIKHKDDPWKYKAESKMSVMRDRLLIWQVLFFMFHSFYKNFIQYKDACRCRIENHHKLAQFVRNCNYIFLIIKRIWTWKIHIEIVKMSLDCWTIFLKDGMLRWI